MENDSDKSYEVSAHSIDHMPSEEMLEVYEFMTSDAVSPMTDEDFGMWMLSEYSRYIFVVRADGDIVVVIRYDEDFWAGRRLAVVTDVEFADTVRSEYEIEESVLRLSDSPQLEGGVASGILLPQHVIDLFATDYHELGYGRTVVPCAEMVSDCDYYYGALCDWSKAGMNWWNTSISPIDVLAAREHVRHPENLTYGTKYKYVTRGLSGAEGVFQRLEAVNGNLCVVFDDGGVVNWKDIGYIIVK